MTISKSRAGEQALADQAVLTISRFLYVVCLKCGLIADRRRKSTDHRTPDELHQRIQCGNCCARSFRGEVIFSLDGGLTYYDHERESRPMLRGAATMEKFVAEISSHSSTGNHFAPDVDGRHENPWRPSSWPRKGWESFAFFAICGALGVAVLMALRFAVYVYAVALDG